MILNWSKLLSSQAIAKHSDHCKLRSCLTCQISKDSAGEETVSPQGPRQLITAAGQAAEFHGRVGSLCSPTPSHGDGVKQAQENATRLMSLYTASRVEPGRCWSPVRIAVKPAPLSFQVETLASLPWKTLGRKGRSVQLHYSRLAALERDISTARWRDHHP